MTHIPVKVEFSVGQFLYRQLERIGDLAIYAQVRESTILAYEVVKIKRHNGYEIAGIQIEPAEMYPASSFWGINGWTYTSYDKAESKFERLNAAPT